MADPSGKCTKKNTNTNASREETTRCRRLVGALRGASYRVTLTQGEGVEFDDVWTTDRVDEMWEAVRAIDGALGSISFLSVFGGTAQTYVGGGNGLYCASTPGADNISWYDCGSYSQPYTADNIIHEFGHILQNRAGRINGFSMAGTWDVVERRSQYQDEIVANPDLGFALPQLRQNSRALSLNPQDRWAEEVSDMFLFWVRGYGFSTGRGDNGQVGDLRRAFVNGETIPFSDANGGPVDNPGIIDWSRQAAGQSVVSPISPEIVLIGNPITPILPIDPDNMCIDLPNPMLSLI